MGHRCARHAANFGQVLPDSSHALNIGGIPVQTDTALLEKQQAFNRSKIQERIVHPCGSSAFGKFTVTEDISHLTKADFLQPGTVTPAYTRFSTVTYGREYPDAARNPRGFATKFCTTAGNFDLVGLSWPIFFVRDPFMGPDNIRSQQRNPRNFFLDVRTAFLGALRPFRPDHSCLPSLALLLPLPPLLLHTQQYNAWFDFLANVPESNRACSRPLSASTPLGQHRD